MKSVRNVTKSRLEEGVYYSEETNKYMVRGKKNGRLTTLTAFKKKEDAELYLKQYQQGEIK